MEKVVGIFKGSVSQPYPCQCAISVDRGDNITFDHRELLDLKYLVDSMIRDAQVKTKES